MRKGFKRKDIVRWCLLILLLGIVSYSTYLHRVIIQRFEGKVWDIPSQVYSSAFVIFPEMDVDKIKLLDRLKRLNYRAVEEVNSPGDFNFSPYLVEIFLHNFEYPEGRFKGFKIGLQLKNKVIHKITKLPSHELLSSVRLEPELIGSFYGKQREERKIVSLYGVPPYLLEAIITIEDKRFYRHHGVDLRGMARAVLTNLRERRLIQGGSTITQQLAKNLFLSSKRNPVRKINEMIMALLMEATYSKRDILETYLNEVYLGQRGSISVCGVGEAAEFYFNKRVSELTSGEAALIAGLIKNPGRYSPYRDIREAVNRRNFALRKMWEAGKISEEEYKVALKEKIILAGGTLTGNKAPYFLDFVAHKLEEKYPLKTLISEGLKIFTTLDMEMQLEAERTLKEGLKHLENSYPYLRCKDEEEKLQGALVAIDPHTGYIKAMVGGRDYRVSQFNRVWQASRQPGSLFKPIVYLAALERGQYTLGSIIEDSPLTIKLKNGEWSPQNYGGKYRGKVTLRTALEESLNTATVRLAQNVGLSRVIELAHSLGIESPLPEVPSLALGSVEATPLEITQPYATVANGGIRHKSIAVRAVVDRSGKILLQDEPKGKRVVSQQAAYLITYLLKGVVKEGTASRLRKMGFEGPAAAKTGTSSNYKDAWFIGYTPDMVVCVWVGFDHNKSLNLSGSQVSLPLWVKFVENVNSGNLSQDFAIPEGIVFKEIDKNTGKLATGACPDVIQEAFIRGTEPGEFCSVHKENLIQWIMRKIFGPKGERY